MTVYEDPVLTVTRMLSRYLRLVKEDGGLAKVHVSTQWYDRELLKNYDGQITVGLDRCDEQLISMDGQKRRRLPFMNVDVWVLDNPKIESAGKPMRDKIRKEVSRVIRERRTIPNQTDYDFVGVGPLTGTHKAYWLTSEEQKFEYYDTGGDIQLSIYGDRWLGQTFTPQVRHKITSVKVKLRRTGLPGTVTACIKACTSNEVCAEPTGPDLCSGTTDGNSLPDGSFAWREISFAEGVILEKDVRYAFIIKALDADGSDKINILNDFTDATYPRGGCFFTENGGGTWIVYDDVPCTPTCCEDLMFEEWGFKETDPTAPEWHELTADDYVKLWYSDDDRYSYSHNDAPKYAMMLFRFKIESKGNVVKKIVLSFEGYGTAPAGNGITIKVWDHVNEVWENAQVGTGGADETITITLTSDLTDYIDDDGYVWLLARTTNPSDGTTAAVLYCDYALCTITVNGITYCDVVGFRDLDQVRVKPFLWRTEFIVKTWMFEKVLGGQKENG